MVGDEKLDFAVLHDADSCAGCHAEIVSMWKQSTHRLSAFANPFYRVSLEDFVAEKGAEKAKFCNGCHDIGLQFDAKPAGVDLADDRGFQGVTCGTCHGIVDVTTDGNASYTLTTSRIPVPTGDAQSLEDHRSRVASPILRSDRLCISCHRGFLSQATGHEVVIGGVDEFGPFRLSGYGGSKGTRIDEPVAATNCRGCHMPYVDFGAKKLPSHRFPGGHTTLATLQGSEAQLEAQRNLLVGAASLDIVALEADGARMVPGEEESVLRPGTAATFDVVVRNTRTAHLFPGGAKDMRDTWVEVVVMDNKGAVVASAGADHEKTGRSLTAYRLRATMIDNNADAVFEHKVAAFRTPVYNRTITPRDAAIARFSFDVPAGLATDAFPLSVQARLRHRRIQVEHQRRTCAEAKTPRGKQFRAKAKRLVGVDLDPCLEQPVIDIAQAQSWLGPGAGSRLAKQTRPEKWRRLWEHGLGLQHHVQEKLEETKASLLQAQAALPEGAPTWGRAAILYELARVAGRQGRTDEALALFDKVEALVPGHPAVARARGDALAAVWRWELAAKAYRAATEGAPNDSRAWRGLAQALGSLDRRPESLAAAQAGLLLEPRDPHLLRSQSLAYARLAPGSSEAAAAREAWLTHRRDELAPSLRGKCKDPTSDCQRERIPIFARAMVAGP